MKLFNITLGFCCLIIIGCEKPSVDQTTDLLFSNYTLILEDSLHRHNDEDIPYSFCSDVSTRPITTSKLYVGDTVLYEVLLGPFNRSSESKIFDFAFSLYWSSSEIDDVSLLNAFGEIIAGETRREVSLDFTIRDRDNSLFSNTTTPNLTPVLADTEANHSLLLSLPNTQCTLYQENVGEITYRYNGFIFNSEKTDSMYVNDLNLTLYLPLNL